MLGTCERDWKKMETQSQLIDNEMNNLRVILITV